MNRQLPHLGNAGRGVNRQLPHLGTAGQGVLDWMLALAGRLRRVRVACGDFERVLSNSVLRGGLKEAARIGVLIDPPYPSGCTQQGFYAGQDGGHSSEAWSRALAWAEANGDRERLRIVVCGYDGMWSPPEGWAVRQWKNTAGYRGEKGQRQEVLWCSPHCIPPSTGDLLDVN